jgi:hypothetical protein
VVELPLYSFLIIWRVKFSEHRLLSRIAYACCIWVLVGATVETAVTIWLLNRSWHRWSLSFRVLLPLVFSLWISTQLYGAWRILGMARSKAHTAGGCHACAQHLADDSWKSESTNHPESRKGGAIYDPAAVSAVASTQTELDWTPGKPFRPIPRSEGESKAASRYSRSCPTSYFLPEPQGSPPRKHRVQPVGS